MTFLQIITGTLLSLGPALILLFTTIILDPLKCVILIASAFFWLLSLFITAIVWFVIVPLRDKLLFAMISSVIIQEGLKYMWYRILRTSENGLQKISNIGLNSNHLLHFKGKNDRIIVSYVSGLGFGLANASLSIINTLFDLNGPGTFGINNLNFTSFVFTKSLCAQVFIFLNIFWTIVLYDGYDKKEYSKVILVITTHLLAVILTYLNVYKFQATIYILYLVMMLLALYTLKLCGITCSSLYKSIKNFVGVS